MRWDKYLDNTKKSSPRPLLVSALTHTSKRGDAIDLGCGIMADTRALLDAGFSHVFAIDSNPTVRSIAEGFPEYGDRLIFADTRLENLHLEPHTYDIVNAQFVLPFVAPNVFPETWNMIKQSLKQGGVFAGQFFGPKDEWVDRTTITFHSLDDVQKLLDGFEIKQLKEVYTKKNLASGQEKQWHLFHVIAVRK